MIFIKCFLILLLVLVYAVFRRYLSGRRMLVRGAATLMLLAGILAVIFPTMTTSIANFVGIGRGADLINYVFIIFLLFSLTVLHGQLSQQHNLLIQLAREIAFMQARLGESQYPQAPMADEKPKS